MPARQTRGGGGEGTLARVYISHRRLWREKRRLDQAREGRTGFASKCIRILIIGIMNCEKIHPNYATETEKGYFTNTLFLLALDRLRPPSTPLPANIGKNLYLSLRNTKRKEMKTAVKGSRYNGTCSWKYSFLLFESPTLPVLEAKKFKTLRFGECLRPLPEIVRH
jgi:hypothetical protein